MVNGFRGGIGSGSGDIPDNKHLPVRKQHDEDLTVGGVAGKIASGLGYVVLGTVAVGVAAAGAFVGLDLSPLGASSSDSAHDKGFITVTARVPQEIEFFPRARETALKTAATAPFPLKLLAGFFTLITLGLPLISSRVRSWFTGERVTIGGMTYYKKDITREALRQELILSPLPVKRFGTELRTDLQAAEGSLPGQKLHLLRTMLHDRVMKKAAVRCRIEMAAERLTKTALASGLPPAQQAGYHALKKAELERVQAKITAREARFEALSKARDKCWQDIRMDHPGTEEKDITTKDHEAMGEIGKIEEEQAELKKTIKSYRDELDKLIGTAKDFEKVVRASVPVSERLEEVYQEELGRELERYDDITPGSEQYEEFRSYMEANRGLVNSVLDGMETAATGSFEVSTQYELDRLQVKVAIDMTVKNLAQGNAETLSKLQQNIEKNNVVAKLSTLRTLKTQLKELQDLEPVTAGDVKRAFRKENLLLIGIAQSLNYLTGLGLNFVTLGTIDEMRSHPKELAALQAKIKKMENEVSDVVGDSRFVETLNTALKQAEGTPQFREMQAGVLARREKEYLHLVSAARVASRVDEVSRNPSTFKSLAAVFKNVHVEDIAAKRSGIARRATKRDAARAGRVFERRIAEATSRDLRLGDFDQGKFLKQFAATKDDYLEGIEEKGFASIAAHYNFDDIKKLLSRSLIDEINELRELAGMTQLIPEDYLLPIENYADARALLNKLLNSIPSISDDQHKPQILQLRGELYHAALQLDNIQFLSQFSLEERGIIKELVNPVDYERAKEALEQFIERLSPSEREAFRQYLIIKTHPASLYKIGVDEIDDYPGIMNHENRELFFTREAMAKVNARIGAEAAPAGTAYLPGETVMDLSGSRVHFATARTLGRAPRPPTFAQFRELVMGPRGKGSYASHREHLLQMLDSFRHSDSFRDPNSVNNQRQREEILGEAQALYQEATVCERFLMEASHAPDISLADRAEIKKLLKEIHKDMDLLSSGIQGGRGFSELQERYGQHIALARAFVEVHSIEGGRIWRNAEGQYRANDGEPEGDWKEITKDHALERLSKFIEEGWRPGDLQLARQLLLSIPDSRAKVALDKHVKAMETVRQVSDLMRPDAPVRLFVSESGGYAWGAYSPGKGWREAEKWEALALIPHFYGPVSKDSIGTADPVVREVRRLALSSLSRIVGQSKEGIGFYTRKERSDSRFLTQHPTVEDVVSVLESEEISTSNLQSSLEEVVAFYVFLKENSTEAEQKGLTSTFERLERAIKRLQETARAAHPAPVIDAGFVGTATGRALGGAEPIVISTDEVDALWRPPVVAAPVAPARVVAEPSVAEARRAKAEKELDAEWQAVVKDRSAPRLRVVERGGQSGAERVGVVFSQGAHRAAGDADVLEFVRAHTPEQLEKLMSGGTGSLPKEVVELRAFIDSQSPEQLEKLVFAEDRTVARAAKKRLQESLVRAYIEQRNPAELMSIAGSRLPSQLSKDFMHIDSPSEPLTKDRVAILEMDLKDLVLKMAAERLEELVEGDVLLSGDLGDIRKALDAHTPESLEKFLSSTDRVPLDQEDMLYFLANLDLEKRAKEISKFPIELQEALAYIRNRDLSKASGERRLPEELALKVAKLQLLIRVARKRSQTTKPVLSQTTRWYACLELYERVKGLEINAYDREAIQPQIDALFKILQATKPSPTELKFWTPEGIARRDFRRFAESYERYKAAFANPETDLETLDSVHTHAEATFKAAFPTPGEEAMKVQWQLASDARWLSQRRRLETVTAFAERLQNTTNVAQLRSEIEDAVKNQLLDSSDLEYFNAHFEEYLKGEIDDLIDLMVTRSYEKVIRNEELNEVYRDFQNANVALYHGSDGTVILLERSQAGRRAPLSEAEILSFLRDFQANQGNVKYEVGSNKPYAVGIPLGHPLREKYFQRNMLIAAYGMLRSLYEHHTEATIEGTKEQVEVDERLVERERAMEWFEERVSPPRFASKPSKYWLTTFTKLTKQIAKTGPYLHVRILGGARSVNLEMNPDQPRHHRLSPAEFSELANETLMGIGQEATSGTKAGVSALYATWRAIKEDGRFKDKDIKRVNDAIRQKIRELAALYSYSDRFATYTKISAEDRKAIAESRSEIMRIAKELYELIDLPAVVTEDTSPRPSTAAPTASATPPPATTTPSVRVVLETASDADLKQVRSAGAGPVVAAPAAATALVAGLSPLAAPVATPPAPAARPRSAAEMQAEAELFKKLADGRSRNDLFSQLDVMPLLERRKIISDIVQVLIANRSNSVFTGPAIGSLESIFRRSLLFRGDFKFALVRIPPDDLRALSQIFPTAKEVFDSGLGMPASPTVTTTPTASRSPSPVSPPVVSTDTSSSSSGTPSPVSEPATPPTPPPRQPPPVPRKERPSGRSRYGIERKGRPPPPPIENQ